MNTDTILQQSLQQLGLTDKEALVYQACLNRGEINIIELSRLTELSRSTAYFIADELVKKGLLRFVQKGAHRVYSIEDPRKIERLLEQERLEVNNKLVMYNALLPKLSMRYQGVARKPVVSYYTGQKEMQQIFEDALLSDIDELLFVGSLSVLRDAVSPEYLATWNRRKVKAGIKTKGIWEKKSDSLESFLEPSKENLRQARYAGAGFESPTYILMYGNKVAYLSSIIEAYGVLIESQDLSISMHSWFDVLWKDATK